MWKVCSSEEFLNAGLIFPLKQRDVLKLINLAKEDTNIQKLVVFGSSVTPGCNPWSDIDLYYEIIKESTIKVTILESAIDIWSNFNVPKGEKLLDEIKENGVLVYERDIIR